MILRITNVKGQLVGVRFAGVEIMRIDPPGIGSASTGTRIQSAPEFSIETGRGCQYDGNVIESAEFSSLIDVLRTLGGER